jgi:hypothetical protein
MERGASVSVVSQDIEEDSIEHGLLTVLGTLELAQMVGAVSGLFFEVAVNEVLVVWAPRFRLA